MGFVADVAAFAHRIERLGEPVAEEAARAQDRLLAVGSDVLSLPRSYDTGLVATFADRAALDAYTVHPEHVKVAEFGRGISEHVASVDFVT